MKTISLNPLLILLFSITLFQSAAQPGKQDIIKQHPSWSMQSNIYEVNIRQYTPEGTFNAFAKHIDRLKAMGVHTLWFMPINPISQTDRKGSLGSYYAVADYTSVNPEFGSMKDFQQLVKRIHQKGMKVLIDWVPNHTGGDHRWLTEQPGFFVKDSSGKAAMAKDWADTRQLDYANQKMRDSMIAAMQFWISNADIDGFRCDVAWNVPGDFWKDCIARLRKLKPVFMLAEGEDAYLPENGFDAVYPWRAFHVLVDIAAGKKSALALDTVQHLMDSIYPKNTMLLHFTSNHDENSWNKADYATMPGASHEPFAVLTQTLPGSIPLVYSGQEEPVLRPLAFFEKDPIGFGQYKRVPLYRKLQHLRTANKAMAANVPMQKLVTGNDAAVYAFYRKSGGQFVYVVVNLTGKPQRYSVDAGSLREISGKPVKELLSGKRYASLPLGKNTLNPWESRVYY
ncbi:MAG TPA: alpha-amylase family glycosyl hydrolase [Sediminibacterium sp.]|nr:alpha-amylase family glycosyl hydrolase [Sediminibacterium sp.]